MQKPRRLQKQFASGIDRICCYCCCRSLLFYYFDAIEADKVENKLFIEFSYLETLLRIQLQRIFSAFNEDLRGFFIQEMNQDSLKG